MKSKRPVAPAILRSPLPRKPRYPARVSPRVRRALVRSAIAAAAVAIGIGSTIGVALYVTFDGVAPLEDGRRVGPAVTVVDGYVACYLLDAGDGTVALIDACADPEGVALLAALDRAGRGPRDVVAVLMTHGHADHRGGIPLFERARIYAHQDELPLLRGEVAAQGPIPQLDGRMAPVAVSDVVHDGDELTIGALRVRVFHLPGHTAGSVAYRVDDTLFLGDNAHGMETGEMEPAPWVFSDDVDANVASLRALPARLDEAGVVVARLVFGHSAPLEGREPLWDFASR